MHMIQFNALDGDSGKHMANKQYYYYLIIINR